MEVKEIEFAKLRHAYITVKSFIEAESYEKIKSLDTKVEKDLGLSGDDNYELLEKFLEKYELDYGDFNYSEHFLSEAELFNSESALLSLFTLSVWLPLKTIELITLNKLKLDKPDFHSHPEKADLSFKDLVTWYVEGEFKTSGNIKYIIKGR
jgi:hypothetical protein